MISKKICNICLVTLFDFSILIDLQDIRFHELLLILDPSLKESMCNLNRFIYFVFKGIIEQNDKQSELSTHLQFHHPRAVVKGYSNYMCMIDYCDSVLCKSAQMQEVIDQYMAKRIEQSVNIVPSDDADEPDAMIGADEDETTRQEFEDFKKWLDDGSPPRKSLAAVANGGMAGPSGVPAASAGSSSRSGESMGPPAAPVRCKCNAEVCNQSFIKQTTCFLLGKYVE